MKETRYGIRTRVQAKALFHGAGGSEGRGIIRDVSHNGVYVQTLLPHKIPSCVVINLLSEDDPERCLYQTAAIVVHRQSDGVGFMLPEGAGDIIDALCQH